MAAAAVPTIPAPQAYVLRLPTRTAAADAAPAGGSVRVQRPEAGPGLEREEAWPVPYWQTDTAMAVQNLLLLAEDRGLGALFFGLFGGPRGTQRVRHAPLVTVVMMIRGTSLRKRRLTACTDDSFETLRRPRGAGRHVAFQKPCKRFQCETAAPYVTSRAGTWTDGTMSTTRRLAKYRPAGTLPKTS